MAIVLWRRNGSFEDAPAPPVNDVNERKDGQAAGYVNVTGKITAKQQNRKISSGGRKRFLNIWLTSSSSFPELKSHLVAWKKRRIEPMFFLEEATKK